MGNIKGDRFPESEAIAGYRTVVSRKEPGMKRKILEILGDGPKTVPEVAEALGISHHEVMWWMMGYTRYGYIAPTGEMTDDGYYRYELVERDD